MHTTLLIRADGGVQLGAGHVMRCLALAQEWCRSDRSAVLATIGMSRSLQEQVSAESVRVEAIEAEPGSDGDAEAFLDIARRYHPVSWVVVDGYHFSSRYQRAVKEAGYSLLSIDDFGHSVHNYADLVLNQNAHAGEDLYPRREANSRLLLGARYALVRRQFLARRPLSRAFSARDHGVLVTLGGADPKGTTARVVQALSAITGRRLDTTVVVGTCSDDRQSFQLAGLASGSGVSVRAAQTASQVAELMRRADLAVSASGSTAWELCFMGLPSLLIVSAENQRPIAEYLNESGIALSLGTAESLVESQVIQAVEQLLADPSRRERMSRSAARLVDGQGAARVVTRLLFGSIRLRPATAEDELLLWRWANDPVVREVSFSPAPIPLDDHRRWFRDRLKSARTTILIGQGETGEDIGQVRFDMTPDGCGVVDVSVAPEHRGEGLGSALILRAVLEMQERGVLRFRALVRTGNAPSRAAFGRAGFSQSGTTECEGQEAVVMTREGSTD